MNLVLSPKTLVDIYFQDDIYGRLFWCIACLRADRSTADIGDIKVGGRERDNQTLNVFQRI